MEQLKGEWEFLSTLAWLSLPFHTMNARQVMATLVTKGDQAAIFPTLALMALLTGGWEMGFSAWKRIKSAVQNRLSNNIILNLIINTEGPPLGSFEACSVRASQRIEE